jgi:hypothetical protein
VVFVEVNDFKGLSPRVNLLLEIPLVWCYESFPRAEREFTAAKSYNRESTVPGIPFAARFGRRGLLCRRRLLSNALSFDGRTQDYLSTA